MMIVSYIGDCGSRPPRDNLSLLRPITSFIKGSKYLTVLAIDTSCP